MDKQSFFVHLDWNFIACIFNNVGEEKLVSGKKESLPDEQASGSEPCGLVT